MPRTFSELQPEGIVKDLPAHLVSADAWTDGQNAHFRDGVPTRIDGYEELFAGLSSAQVLWLFPFLTDTNAFWIFAEETAGAGSDAGIYVTDGTSRFDITPVGGTSTGTRQNAFTSAPLNGVPCLNWQTEPPGYWDLITTNAVQTLPGWEANAKCNALRAFKNYLIALDYTDGAGTRFDQFVRFSDAAEPGQLPTTWIADPSNDAGGRPVTGEPGPVIDGCALRDQFLVFKNNSTFSLGFIGGEFVFELRKLFTTTGVLTRNCCAEFFGRALAMSDGDITLTDGADVQSIATEQVRRFIFSQISSDAYERSFVAHYPAEREVWCCFPSGGADHCNLAAVYNTERGKWHFRDLDEVRFAVSGIVPDTGGVDDWDSDTQAWDDDTTTWDGQELSRIDDRLVLTKNGGGFALADMGYMLEGGGDYTTRLTRESFDFGEPLQVKQVHRVWPRLIGANGITVGVRVGSQMDVDDPITWQPEQPFVIGTDQYVVNFARGRFLSFEFRSMSGQVWKLPSFRVEFGSTMGRF